MLEAKSSMNSINLISDIRHGKLLNSYEVAFRTEQLLEAIISQAKWNTAEELMDIVKTEVRRIEKALPREAAAVNVMKHVLKLIREEYVAGFKSKSEDQQSLHHLVTADLGENPGNYSKPLIRLKAAVMDNLSEYKVELESSAENIAAQASEHIHSNEIVLTAGKSRTVEQFLKSAAKSRQLQVIIVEGAPQLHGHTLAANLAKRKIQVTVIPDSAVFAVMSRVNKVIIGTHTVMANGGLRATCGIHNVALAAKHYSVPVLVLAHAYKFSPVHLCSSEQDAFNVCASPANILPYSNGPLLNKVHVYNPVFDYVPPELVTLFISHQGGNAPSYVYHLLSELYHPDDCDVTET